MLTTYMKLYSHMLKLWGNCAELKRPTYTLLGKRWRSPSTITLAPDICVNIVYNSNEPYGFKQASLCTSSLEFPLIHMVTKMDPNVAGCTWTVHIQSINFTTEAATNATCDRMCGFMADSKSSSFSKRNSDGAAIFSVDSGPRFSIVSSSDHRFDWRPGGYTRRSDCCFEFQHN